MSKRKKKIKRTPKQMEILRKKQREMMTRTTKKSQIRLERIKVATDIEQRKDEIEKEKYSKLTDIEKEVIDYTNVETDFFDEIKEEMGNPIRKIQYIKDEEAKPMECHKNATHLSNKIDGKRVKGWRVYVPDTSGKELFNGMKNDLEMVKALKRYGVVELQQHMVVDKDGILYDNSPTEDVIDEVGFFIQDDRLLTEASSSKGRSVSHLPIDYRKMVGYDMGDYMWGENMVYVSKKGSRYMKTKWSHDIQHISPGKLGCIKSIPASEADNLIHKYKKRFGKNIKGLNRRKLYKR